MPRNLSLVQLYSSGVTKLSVRTVATFLGNRPIKTLAIVEKIATIKIDNIARNQFFRAPSASNGSAAISKAKLRR